MYRSNKSSFGGSFNQFNRGSFNSAPVDVGKQYDVKIEDIARQGDGIARISGLVIFVPNTKLNDQIKVEIKEVKRSCAIAEVVEAPEASEVLEEAE